MIWAQSQDSIASFHNPHRRCSRLFGFENEVFEKVEKAGFTTASWAEDQESSSGPEHFAVVGKLRHNVGNEQLGAFFRKFPFYA